VKKFIMILALVATSAFAEPSFTQIQDLIGRQQYSAAAQGLEQIIHNHPNSAKAFYSMAQAQAGLGNLDKARYALDKATGLDPTLSFASESQVQSLREALTPQVAKIEKVEESHFWRNLVLILFAVGIGFIIYRVYKNNKKADEDYNASFSPVKPINPAPDDYNSASPSDKAYMREHNMAPKPEAYIYKSKPVERKEEKKEVRVSTPAPSYSAPTPQPVAHTTVVNNSSNDGLLTGMILGNMMSDHHHHDRIIEREVVREVPVKSSESSSSRSSSWDSDDSSSSWSSGSSSSSRSSSWDSDSSSSSSSWSSSSDSSSSWDSGSSSSSWD
jgi:tetratricopeptide (TPR) repeat protein